ncbi:hypothetical protein AVEN_185305-1 [Araneus ventricosus]|uniref:Uncharacterized protein n=1 Tax=Araneus ventricosus TaxID=182803 RepID=A0A4Y2JU10_ARAVE|nr:hypothetical protein AVEN_185305-1 [Araneus ventricosus]
MPVVNHKTEIKTVQHEIVPDLVSGYVLRLGSACGEEARLSIGCLKSWLCLFINQATLGVKRRSTKNDLQLKTRDTDNLCCRLGTDSYSLLFVLVTYLR